MRLHKKISLVTGAGSGIGMAIAHAFLKEGAQVIMNDISKDRLGEAIKWLKDGEPIPFIADVSDSNAANLMTKRIIEKFGKIDILVNVAGIYTHSLVVEMEDETWDRLMSVNLRGVFNCCRAVAKFMMNIGEGSIISISSIGGVSAASIQHAHYSASKAGIIGFNRTLAKELGNYGIRCNVIAPGVIERTPMGDDAKMFVGKNYIENLPLKRWGKPEDIASAAVFLASEESAWITGETLNVNGGAFMP